MTKIAQLHKALVDHLEQHGDVLLDREHLSRVAYDLLKSNAIAHAEEERRAIVEAVLDKMVGWGPLTPLLNDPSITEIMVNGTASLYVERNGRLEEREPCFQSPDEIMHIVSRMVSQVGRRIDTASPLVDARLPDGSRINAIIEPLSLMGPVLTIRRFSKNPMTLARLVQHGTVTPEVATFLRNAVRAKCNILISGGTGSGKTTTLNAIASCIPKEERVVTIEDAAEMRLEHPHLVALESRPPNIEGRGEIPVRILLKNALRMRPDRIIVGEIRGGEALDMLQAMNTGHQGSLTTVHANAALEALLRTETMTLMADVELPLHAIRSQIRQALHLIVHQERFPDGTRKIVSVSAVSSTPASDDAYTVVPIATYNKGTRAVTLQPIPEEITRWFDDANIHPYAE
jgi:pilus assembly protein CpaF